jgi:hypothetical protein
VTLWSQLRRPVVVVTSAAVAEEPAQSAVGVNEGSVAPS